MPHRTRRWFVCSLGATPLLGCLPALAQSWPTRPVKLIVTFAAGGGADLVAREIAPRLGDALGQPFIVENHAGAGGLIGDDLVAKAPPDGQTLLLGAAGPLTVAPHLYAKVPYDTLADLVPVALVATTPFVLVVNPDVQASNVADLTALAKASPGKLVYGSSGTGGAPHLAGELYDNMAGVKMTHAPYKGLAPAINDLLGGHIQVLFADTGLVVPHIKAGKLKALAVTGRQRSPLLPDVPTLREAGLPDYQAGSWYGILAPAGIPPAIVSRVNAEVRAALASPDLQHHLIAQGLEPSPATPEEFAALLHADYAKWGKLIKQANIKLD